MIRWTRIAVALGLALGLGVASYWGFTLFALATVFVVLSIAYGWPRLTDSPQPRATSIMLALFGIAAIALTWHAKEPPYLEWLPVLAGLGLLWAFVQNLVRGLGASHAVANVSAQVSGLVIVLSVGSWVAAIGVEGDKEAIVVGLISLLAAQCMTALPWPARYTSPLAIVMAGAMAGVVGAVLQHGSIGPLVAITLGVIMGLLVAAVDRMLGLIAMSRYQAAKIAEVKRLDKARSFAVQLVLGGAPIALGGVVVYVLERIFIYR